VENVYTFKKPYKEIISNIIIMNISNRSYSCNICNKKYKSYKSWWNHNKIFHKSENHILHNVHNCPPQVSQHQLNLQNNIENNKPKCIFCNKVFSRNDAVKRHETTCKNKEKINEEKKNEIELEKIKLLKKQEEKELVKLKLKLRSKKKIETISFNSLNKMLKNNNYINNITNTSNTTNNIQNNNVQLISFGKNEHIADHLTHKEQKLVILSGNKCIEKLIDISYNGPYNQFKNIIITNLKDNFVYKYDDVKGYFVAANKNDTLKDFIDTRVMDIEEIYNKLSDAKKIDENTKNTIEKFLEKIQNYNEKFVDNTDNITYPSYRDYKINKIKILLYNNQDKITKDLALYYMPE